MSSQMEFLNNDARNGLEHYCEKYAQFIALTRQDGILECRFHHEQGPAVHGWEAHHAWREAWIDIGRDPETRP